MLKKMYRTLLAALLLWGGLCYAEGYRTEIADGARKLPVCVVKGTPYEMGKSLGQLMKEESQNLAVRMLLAVQTEDPAEFSDAALDKAWNTTSPYISDRFKEELRGFSEGAGIPLATLQHVHMIPLIAEYSCSSIALWGDATQNRDLYLTRNLDWVMELLAHDFPMVVVYLPTDGGIPHVNLSFSGYLGCNTGFNAEGIALSEMGNAGGKDKPYDLNGYHFTMFFRDMLYECKTLDQAVAKVKSVKGIKKYHYVIGSGKEKRAVKIRTNKSNLEIWADNDPKDEHAPSVGKNFVYEDEGRGAFPLIQKDLGKHTGQTVIDIVKAIPIKGDNVLGVVYDATTFEMWFAYAQGETEAYKRAYVHLDVKPLLDFSKPMQPVVATAGGDAKSVPASAPKPATAPKAEFKELKKN